MNSPRVVLLRSHLYAPGNNPRLVEKVFQAGADAVALDLEDAVPWSEKQRARALVAEAVRARSGFAGPAVFVRINHPSTGLAEEDVRMVVQPGLEGLRLPKIESAEEVRQIATWVDQAEQRNGVDSGRVALLCTIESATGVFYSYNIGRASPRVSGLAFGATDFIRDLGIAPEDSERGTQYARSQIVLASRVARLQPPVDSVYTRLEDSEGLERSVREGRALGFFGKSAIHPKQLAAIHAAYSPSEAEIVQASKIVSVATAASANGKGALQLEGGEFVDTAVVRRAEDLLALAARLEKNPEKTNR